MIQSDQFNFDFPADGPYMLQSHSANSEVYVKNPSFHSNFFKGPNAIKLIYQTFATTSALIAAFRAGQIDEADGFTINDIATFNSAGIPTSEQIVGLGSSFERVDFNERPQALNALDPNNTGKASIFSGAKGRLVRQAFIESFNLCAAFVAVLNDSNCNDPNLRTFENTVPPLPDYDPIVIPPAYNPTQAAKDLASAGLANCRYPNGKQVALDIILSSGEQTQQAYAALAAQEWALNLGCQVKVTIENAGAIGCIAYFCNYQATLDTGSWDLAIEDVTLSSECALNLAAFSSANLPSNTNALGDNYMGIHDPQVDTMVGQAARQSDTTLRAAICKKVQAYLISQSYDLPLFHKANYALASPNLMNFVLDPTSAGNTWNIADWWINQAP